MDVEIVLTGSGPDISVMAETGYLPRTGEYLFLHRGTEKPFRYIVKRVEWHLDASEIYACQIIAERA